MTAAPNSAFENFLRDIEPSPTTKSNSSSAHGALRAYLAKDEGLGEHHARTLLSGSYKRDTAIRPVMKEGVVDRPDVDIVVIVNYGLTDLPETVLDNLFRGITGDGSPYKDSRRQPRSVRVTTSKAVMDVVPLIEPYGEGGTLYIPDRKASEWLSTNPPGHTQWTTDVNKAAGGRFKPLVKLFKWWRRENPTISGDPKGFVLECLVAGDMSMSETHYGELFVGTAEAIAERYKGFAESDTVPFVQDPGVPSQSVLTGVSAAAFKGFVNKLKAHAEKGRKALAEEGAPAATKMWRELFGPRFPDLGDGKSVASGPIPVPPPTFPDRPVRPRKPGGFASTLVL